MPLAAMGANARFGSSMLTGLKTAMGQVAEPIFRATTTEKIWELMLLDTVALWMPRIYNALSRGRVETTMSHLQSQPQNQGRSKTSLKAEHLAKNFKGLNWSNGIEETWREIQSAPMVLAAQSAMFAAFVGGDKMRRAVLLPKNHLDAINPILGDLTQKAVGNASVQQALHVKHFNKISYETMKSLLLPHFQQHPDVKLQLDLLRENAENVKQSILTPKAVQRALSGQSKSTQTEQFLRWFESSFPNHQKQLPSFEHMAEKWLQDWHKVLIQPNMTPAKRAQSTEVLNVIIRQYNEQAQRHNPLQALNSINAKPLDSLWGKAYVGTTEKLHDYLKGVFGHIKTNAASYEGKPMAEAMQGAANLMRKNLIGRKFLYSLSTMAFCILLYFGSSMHAQSNNAYPANRLIHGQNRPYGPGGLNSRMPQQDIFGRPNQVPFLGTPEGGTRV